MRWHKPRLPLKCFTGSRSWNETENNPRAVLKWSRGLAARFLQDRVGGSSVRSGYSWSTLGRGCAWGDATSDTGRRCSEWPSSDSHEQKADCSCLKAACRCFFSTCCRFCSSFSSRISASNLLPWDRACAWWGKQKRHHICSDPPTFWRREYFSTQEANAAFEDQHKSLCSHWWQQQLECSSMKVLKLRSYQMQFTWWRCPVSVLSQCTDEIWSPA